MNKRIKRPLYPTPRAENLSGPLLLRSVSCRLIVSCCLIGVATMLLGCNPSLANSSVQATESQLLAEQTAGGTTEGPSDDNSAQWPMFRGNSLGTGVTTAELPEKLDVLWKHEIPNGQFESTAAVVDGVVYTADMDGQVLALDLETGKVQWEFQAEIGFFSIPRISQWRIVSWQF